MRHWTAAPEATSFEAATVVRRGRWNRGSGRGSGDGDGGGGGKLRALQAEKLWLWHGGAPADAVLDKCAGSHSF